MINPLEQEFYDAFKIKPIFENREDSKRYRAYPRITDRILLSLYCLWSINTENDKLIRFECPENLKSFTLEHLIRLAKNKCVYYGVHSIMEVEE